MPRERVTMKDIADATGFSTVTVRKVMEDAEGVNLDTYVQIRQKALEMGYRYGNKDFGLTVGVVFHSWLDPFETRAVRVVSDVFQSVGYGYHAYPYTVGSHPVAAEMTSLAKLNDPPKLAGIILINPHMSPEVYPKIYVNRPTILINSVGSAPRPELDIQLGVNDNMAVESAMEHLLELGHRKIGFISELKISPQVANRQRLYESILQDRGLYNPNLVAYSDRAGLEGGYAATIRLLDKDMGVTAIFGQDDRFAAGAIRASQDRGLEVPQDISVMGYGDLEMGDYWIPRITTVDVSYIETSRNAAVALAAFLQGEDIPFMHPIQKPNLLMRQSVAAPLAS